MYDRWGLAANILNKRSMRKISGFLTVLLILSFSSTAQVSSVLFGKNRV